MLQPSQTERERLPAYLLSEGICVQLTLLHH